MQSFSIVTVITSIITFDGANNYNSDANSKNIDDNNSPTMITIIIIVGNLITMKMMMMMMMMITTIIMFQGEINI